MAWGQHSAKSIGAASYIKDIKPANVLVDDAGSVRLTGFGIASQLPHERQSPVPPEIITGTLAYMAPEQTGRMNRSIDASIKRPQGSQTQATTAPYPVSF